MVKLLADGANEYLKRHRGEPMRIKDLMKQVHTTIKQKHAFNLKKLSKKLKLVCDTTVGIKFSA